MRWHIRSFAEKNVPQYSLEEKQELFEVHQKVSKTVPLEMIVAFNLLAKETVQNAKSRSVSWITGRISDEDTKYLKQAGYGVGKESLLSTFRKDPIITPERPLALNAEGIDFYFKKIISGDIDMIRRFDGLYEDRPYTGILIAEYRPVAQKLWWLLGDLTRRGAKTKEDLLVKDMPATPNLSTMFYASRDY